jgi:hypothetical protein
MSCWIFTWLIYSCHFAQVPYSCENSEWAPLFFSLVHKVLNHWIPWRNLLWRIEFKAVEIGPDGLTATRGRSDCQPLFQGGLTATRGSLTASSLNGKKFQIVIVVTSLVVWPRVALWSDSEVHRIFQTVGFWSVGYIYSSNSSKIGLLAISTAHLTLESSLLSHTSIPWSIVGVWDSRAWFECSWALWH